MRKEKFVMKERLWIALFNKLVFESASFNNTTEKTRLRKGNPNMLCMEDQRRKRYL